MTNMTVELSLDANLMSKVLTFILEQYPNAKMDLQVKNRQNGATQVSSSKNPATRVIKTRTRRSRRGPIEEAVLGFIKAAGEAGVSVADVSKALGISSQQAHGAAWRLYNRGKKTRRLLNGYYVAR